MLYGINTDSGCATCTTASFDGIEQMVADRDTLHPVQCYTYCAAATPTALLHLLHCYYTYCTASIAGVLLHLLHCQHCQLPTLLQYYYTYCTASTASCQHCCSTTTPTALPTMLRCQHCQLPLAEFASIIVTV